MFEPRFEPRTHYCHIHLACTSVCYNRKVHGTKLLKVNTNYLKVNTKYLRVKFHIKNLVCFNFIEI